MTMKEQIIIPPVFYDRGQIFDQNNRRICSLPNNDTLPAVDIRELGATICNAINSYLERVQIRNGDFIVNKSVIRKNNAVDLLEASQELCALLLATRKMYRKPNFTRVLLRDHPAIKKFTEAINKSLKP